MAEKTKSIVPKKEQAIELNPGLFMQQAIDKGVTPEIMEKFMNLYDRWEAKKAKKAFDEAMAGFQGECPIISKGKGVKNKDGSMRYHYAPLDEIVRQTSKIIARHGLSYTINAEVKENKVMATVTVTHEAGHSQASGFEVPLDADSFMNAAQKYGAALTYAKRYAFCNAFGILTGEPDTDAVGGEKESAIFAKLKAAINKAEEKDLADFETKLAKSDKYTPEQKIDVAGLIEKRRKELSAQDKPAA